MNEVIQCNNNIFEDLGFPPEEALSLKIRADLMLDLKAYIQCQKWTQVQAAEFFGETQPRISNLMNGEVSRFSIDKLIDMLARTNMEIRIEVFPKAA